MATRPATCIADSNSIQFLSSVQLARRDSWLWLCDDFDLHVSNEVAREVGAAASPVRSPIKRWVRRHALAIDLKSYERALDNAGIQHNGLHPGELANLRLGLALVVGRPSCGIVVLLTDDENALQFACQRPELNGTSIRWRSHDVILYTYIRHHDRITLDDAKAALRDVHSMASHDSHQDRWTGLHARYQRSLDGAFGLLQHLR